MNEVFFIDLEGNIIDDDKIESHIGLAKKVVESDEKLLEEYRSSGYEQEDLFLAQEKGFALASNMPYNRFLLINKEKATKKQKEVLYGFVQEGYKFHFIEEDNDKKMTI